MTFDQKLWTQVSGDQNPEHEGGERKNSYSSKLKTTHKKKKHGDNFKAK